LAGDISLASLAIGHDINPNTLHRWVLEHERQGRHRMDDITADSVSWPGRKRAVSVETVKIVDELPSLKTEGG